jgi:hypothetical protein
MKCKAHSQGDRCRKESGHEATDPVHEGQFTKWQENKFREELDERKAPRRNRQLNRFLAKLDPAAVPTMQRPRMIAVLNRALKELGAA